MGNLQSVISRLWPIDAAIGDLHQVHSRTLCLGVELLRSILDWFLRGGPIHNDEIKPAGEGLPQRSWQNEKERPKTKEEESATKSAHYNPMYGFAVHWPAKPIQNPSNRQSCAMFFLKDLRDDLPCCIVTSCNAVMLAVAVETLTCWLRAG